MRLLKMLPQFILLLLFLINNQNIFSQDILHSSQSLSVVIMPFEYQQHYPYQSDETRNILMTSFAQGGYNVVQDEDIYRKIDDYEFDLYKNNKNVGIDLAKRLSDTDVDLIVWGQLHYVSHTGVSMYSHNFDNWKWVNPRLKVPVTIKVFDVKKGKIIFRGTIDPINFPSQTMQYSRAEDAVTNLIVYKLTKILNNKSRIDGIPN